jgi:RNA polymerase sigma-70 factor (ECF subfamily)
VSKFPDQDPESDLLTSARGGDAAAWRYLYDAYATPVYTLIRRMVGRAAVAEELTQDVFVEMLRNLDAFSGSGSFAGWVRSVAVSKALMHVRSPWYRLSRLALGGDLQAEADKALPGPGVDTDSAELERALNLLPSTARSVVWLHDVEGYTHEEIAALFQRSTSFSKSQLARAHSQLRVQLQSATEGIACTHL